MKKFFMMLPLMVALVAFVGCSKTTDEPVEGENLKENDPYYNSFEIVDYDIFEQETTQFVPGSETTLNIEGEETAVQLEYLDFYAWDSNVRFNDQTNSFDGNGHILGYENIPLYVIMEGQHEGSYIIPTNGFRVAKTSKAEEGVMSPGVIDPDTYGDYIDYIMFGGEEPSEHDFEKICKETNGTLFAQAVNSNGAQEYFSFVFRGAINRMVINLGEEGEITSWGADVNWSNMTGDQRCYGFHFDPETNTMTKPYNYRSVNRKFHEDVLNAPQQAPAVNATRVITVNNLRKAHPAVKK